MSPLIQAPGKWGDETKTAKADLGMDGGGHVGRIKATGNNKNARLVPLLVSTGDENHLGGVLLHQQIVFLNSS
jgi:hypothetical protein